MPMRAYNLLGGGYYLVSRLCVRRWAGATSAVRGNVVPAVRRPAAQRAVIHRRRTNHQADRTRRSRLLQRLRQASHRGLHLAGAQGRHRRVPLWSRDRAHLHQVLRVVVACPRLIRRSYDDSCHVRFWLYNIDDWYRGGGVSTGSATSKEHEGARQEQLTRWMTRNLFHKYDVVRWLIDAEWYKIIRFQQLNIITRSYHASAENAWPNDQPSYARVSHHDENCDFW